MPSLLDELYADGPQFDFFQAVCLVEESRAGRLPKSLDPVERLGDAVRLRALPSLSFPASSIHRVEPEGGWDRSRPDLLRGLRGDPPNYPSIVNTFFGLIGSSGVLPIEYTELVCRLEREAPPGERTALRDWFDLFHHRLGLLLYAGWEKYRFPVGFRRGRKLGGPAHDPFTRAVFSLVGLGSPSLMNRLRVEAPPDPAAAAGDDPPPPLASVPDLGLLHYAGIFARRVPTALGLRAVLADYFGVAVELEELTGQWLSLSPDAQTRLEPGGACLLGQNAIAGERVWDATSKFRLTIGPVGYRLFEEFLPDPTPVPERKAFYLLCQIVRLHVGPELDWEVRLRLRGDEVPACVLAPPEAGGLGPRLGWNCWLPRQRPAESADEAAFDQRDQVVISH